VSRGHPPSELARIRLDRTRQLLPILFPPAARFMSIPSIGKRVNLGDFTWATIEAFDLERNYMDVRHDAPPGVEPRRERLSLSDFHFDYVGLGWRKPRPDTEA
jgi:hypothetical protein